MMPKLPVILLVSLLASPAAAQHRGEEPRACVPAGERFINYDRERSEDWAQEVARLRKNAGDVTRQDDKLTLRKKLEEVGETGILPKQLRSDSQRLLPGTAQFRQDDVARIALQFVPREPRHVTSRRTRLWRDSVRQRTG